jgi:hypothetical protein
VFFATSLGLAYLGSERPVAKSVIEQGDATSALAPVPATGTPPAPDQGGTPAPEAPQPAGAPAGGGKTP